MALPGLANAKNYAFSHLSIILTAPRSTSASVYANVSLNDTSERDGIIKLTR